MQRFKVVISDYVWDRVKVERDILGPDVELVALRTKSEDEFIDAVADCDALLNTYAGPITAKAHAHAPRQIIIHLGCGGTFHAGDQR
jgi:D-3-phosphoglycerate dehydrogenase / 2-oxoglutarate reductase